MKVARLDTLLSEEHAKDAGFEEAISTLNGAVGPAEHWEDLPETLPTLHVIGVPRSGTTLLTQLVASHLDVSCISNLVAAFWSAPCLGLRLARRLLAPRPNTTYTSSYGRTTDISEPHEFGYFWSDLLGYRELREPTGDPDVDWDRVRRALTNMCAAAGRPIVFKSFALAYHALHVQQVLPRTCFVWVRRDPVDNALSLLRARRAYGGDLTSWVGLKPAEFSWLQHETPAVQVAGQVIGVERGIRDALRRNGLRNTLMLRHSDVCAHPEVALDRIAGLLRTVGVEVGPTRGDLPDLRVSPRTADPMRDEVVAAFESLARRAA